MQRNPLSPGLTLLALAAAGGAVYYATRKKTLPGMNLPPGTTIPPVAIPKVFLPIEDGVVFGKTSPTFIAAPDVLVDITGNVAVVRAPTLPIQLIVSVPGSYAFSQGAEAGAGNELVAGEPMKSRDFIFKINEYAQRTTETNKFDLEEYSAFITANRTGLQNVPMFIFVEPGV